MHTDARGYAYETYREGGRVCRRYVGRGEVAAAVLHLDRLDRQRDDEARREQRAQIAAINAPGAALNELCARSEAFVSDAMTRAGYHRHKRGAWRKRREEQTTMPQKTLLVPRLEKEPKTDFAKAQKDALSAHAFFDEIKGTPGEATMLDALATVREVAADAIVQRIGGGNELIKEAHRRRLDLTARELAGPNPTALELHVAQRVALCELAVAKLEDTFAFQSVGASLKVWEATGRQLDAAHRRHLSAIKTLASVRKAQLPDVQINIAEKQVNIGTLETR